MSTNSTSDRFPNLYWSIDYVTGLNNLKSQSFKSLKQLHELRKLVFNYMTYYHANSEFLNKSSIDLFPVESTFYHLNTILDQFQTLLPHHPIGKE